MVVMPRYACDEKHFTEQSPLDSAHISCRLAATHKWAAPGRDIRRIGDSVAVVSYRC
jgi:hypothetical protein